MRQLSKIQKEFLLENYFKLHITEEPYDGWKGIAEKLLSAGTCIVAGKKPFWRGGIGNFINVTDAEGSVGCSLYTFDLEEFFKSKFFEQFHKEYITLLAKDVSYRIAQLEQIRDIKLNSIIE
jgi:hypothetical protein